MYSFTFPRILGPLVVCCIFIFPFRFFACMIWFYGPVNTVRFMSGRSDDLLIILYSNKFEGPTVAQIVFDMSSRQDFILLYYKKHNSVKISDCLQKSSGNRFIIPIQHTKFQGSSSNTFRDIMLTRFHYACRKRCITMELVRRKK